MSGPEVGNGYTRIANELAEVWARYPWPGLEARRVYDVLVRQCYGYKRKWADVSYRRFGQLTGLSTRSVRRALDQLMAAGIVRQAAEEGAGSAHRTRRYELSSHWEEWAWGKASMPERDSEAHRLVYAETEKTPPPPLPPHQPPSSGGGDIPVPRETPESNLKHLSTDLSTGEVRPDAHRGGPAVELSPVSSAETRARGRRGLDHGRPSSCRRETGRRLCPTAEATSPGA